jgi:farnesyl-diphosphate farnesyltransferase
MQWIDILLKKFSRSFYLTIRVLPPKIRQAISLGYLLARTTDTVADEVALPTTNKFSLLTTMSERIVHGLNNHGPISMDPSFTSLVLSQAQHTLLISFDKMIASLFELPDNIRLNIIQTLTYIIQAQRLDLDRFGQIKGLSCLLTIDEFQNYLYLIAGNVGECWTKICLDELPNYSRKSLAELKPLAINFGKGLQLVNILRDLPVDLKNGRCYLPLEQLEQQKLNCLSFKKDSIAFKTIAKYWWSHAVTYLNDGWKYMLTIKHHRIRYALALPLLIGFATLAKLQDMQYLATNKHIKVSRRYLKILILIAFLGSISKSFFCLTRITSFSHLISATP